MPGGRGPVPRRGAQDIRREDDHPAEGLQRAARHVKQEGLGPAHTPRLHAGEELDRNFLIFSKWVGAKFLFEN